MKYIYLKNTPLILTTILSLVAISYPYNNALSEPTLNLTNNRQLIKQRRPNPDRLPNEAANAVLRMASQRTGLRISQLRIVKAEQVFTDGCLSLPRPNEACTKIGIYAWEVTVRGGRKLLVYRTNSDGSLIRLNEQASNINSNGLPSSVSNAVLKKASEEVRLPISRLQIVNAKRVSWAYGCERSTFPRPCDPVLVNGWQVTVESRQNRWVYNTDENGSLIRSLPRVNPS
ncbi:MAG TPA: hypothetical protein V6D28_18000 [Leptolyngbyaceae cyanobacterium]